MPIHTFAYSLTHLHIITQRVTNLHPERSKTYLHSLLPVFVTFTHAKIATLTQLYTHVVMITHFHTRLSTLHTHTSTHSYVLTLSKNVRPPHQKVVEGSTEKACLKKQTTPKTKLKKQKPNIKPRNNNNKNQNQTSIHTDSHLYTLLSVTYSCTLMQAYS